MVLLLALGAWLVGGPGRTGEPVRIGPLRGNLVIDRTNADDWRYTIEFRDAPPTRSMSEAEVRDFLGPAAVDRIHRAQGNALFKLLNITGWGGLIWVAVGFGGQIAFFGRMAIQWVVSEKRRQSVVPESFWWLSLIGGVALFTYFVWRQDLVGVLGQSSGVVIYARNIRLIAKQRRRDARAAARGQRRADRATSAASPLADPAPEPVDRTS
jgi:lipid-A-disaccharide synthase-like uncharacterized protein